MNRTIHLSNRILSAVLTMCMILSMFAGFSFTASAEETETEINTAAVETVSTAPDATEIIYCGATLNAQTPYLHITKGDNPTVIASAYESPETGYILLAEFAEGTLTYKYGYLYDEVNSKTALYSDIGYNTYVKPTLHDDGIYYGIKANGNLTIDVDAWRNAIMFLWNDLTGNMNVIDVAGDLTIKGTSGFLKIHAVPGKDDVTDGQWHTNGIRADGDVNFEGGETYIYARPFLNSDADDTSTFVNAGGDINLCGGKLKMRTWTGMPGDATLFSSEPNIIGDYVEEDNTNEDLEHDPLKALGFISSTTKTNERNKTYIPQFTLAFEENDADEEMADITKPWGGEVVDLTAEEYAPTKENYSFGGWFNDEKLLDPATQISFYTNKTVYAKWESPLAVTGVTLDRENLSLDVGETRTLTPSIIPGKAANKAVTWRSANENVVTVSDSGVVTAVGAGTTTVTVTTVDGSFTDSCTVAVSASAGANPATEVVYCGVTLNSAKPYLVANYNQKDGFRCWSTATETEIADTDYVLAYFDATKGAFTYKYGYLRVNDDGSYEPDFDWNKGFDAVQIGSDYYGMKANGDLLVDLGGYDNFINMNWNKIYTCNLYGIYAEGDVTLVGDGFLKLPATLAMNMDATKGDANAVPHYSYGIYAEGDVNLNGGSMMIYSRNTNKWGSGTNANSIGFHAGKDINLNGTTIKFRYEETVGNGTIRHFADTPVGIDDYVKKAITNIDMSSGQYASLGYCYVNNTITNNNCYNYYRPSSVSGVVISRSKLYLKTEEKFALSATVLPEEAENKAVRWSSSNREVATVANGVVSATGTGTAVITVTTVDGEFTDSCTVIVTDPTATVAVTGVKLDKSVCYLEEGKEASLSATVMPSNATNKSVVWSTSNNAVATVKDGKITAVGEGTATITVTTEDGDYTASCAVTVLGAKEAKPATEIIYAGVTLNAETPYLIYWIDNGLRIKAQADATVAEGELPLAYFDATTGTLDYRNGRAFAKDEANSYEPDLGWNTYADAVLIDDAYYGIKANGDLTINLNGYNNFINCNWNKIFTSNLYGIYAEGDVTIKGDGYLKLPATLAMNKDTTNGDGNAEPHYSYGIYATGDVTLAGGTVMIYSKNTNRALSGSNAHSVGIYAGRSINLDGTKLKFRYEEAVGEGKIQHFNNEPVGLSEYTKLAVDNIKMAGGEFYSLGYCYYDSAISNKNCFNYVPATSTEGITISPSSANVAVGGSVNLTAKVTSSTAGTEVIWTSSNKAIATVNGGVVKGIAPGIVTITATTTDGKSATCRVVVTSTTSDVTLYIDNVAKTLTTPIVVAGDNVVYVPLVETFKLLGVTMNSYVSGSYVGYGKNGEIVVRIGETKAEVDWVDIELPGPVIVVNNITMVPAYLIEDAIKTEPPVYNANAKALYVKSSKAGAFYGYNKAKTGEIMKTLTTGKVVASPSDFLVGSGKTGTTEANATNVPVTINGTNYTAVQIQTTARPYGEIPEGGAMRYSLRLPNIPGMADFNEGDVGVIHFKARSVDSTLDTKAGKVSVLYERSLDWQKLAATDFEIDYNIWNDYYIPFYAKKMGASNTASWPAASSFINFNVGGAPQIIQIADFSVTYYGKTVDIETLDPDVGSYHGIEEDALWRKEAYRRIERHRKEDVELKVVDPSGNPIQGADIIVKQTESDFLFGVEVCKNEILDLDLTTNIGRTMDTALESFNAAVCGLEMKPGKVVQDDGVNGIKMTNEFLSRGMRMRGHAFYWELASEFNAINGTHDYKTLTYDEIYRNAIEYAETMAYTFKGKSPQWDVINEFHSDNYVRTNFDTTRLHVDVVNAVHNIDPDVKLYVNETNTQGKNKGGFDRVTTLCSIVKRMIDEGATIDGIGLQTHERFYYYPQGLYKQLDECAQIVDEVAVTEYDFGNAFTENKAQYIIDNLIATFSHPQSTAFMVWAYNSNGHIEKLDFFYDMSWQEQPVKALWDKLVNETFKTNLELTTKADGRADFRGFHGDYEITVRYGGQEATFDFGLVKDAENAIQITVGDGIYADVTAGKQIEIPTPVEYESVSEAREAMEKELGKRPYLSVGLETRLIGVANQSQVKNATTLSSNASYNAGSVWASSTGMSSIALDEGTGKGMAFKNMATGSYTMSHLLNGGSFYNEGNLEMSYLVETGSSRKDGFSLAMNFITKSGGVINYGKVKTSTSGYYVETMGGAKIYLADNTIYDIVITLVQTEYPGVYDLKYTVKQSNTVVKELVEKQTHANNFLAINGISVTAQGNSADSGVVLIFREARVRFYSYEKFVSFSKAGTEAELISEPMLHFNVADITISTEDAGYLNGDKWGSDLDDPSVYFGYFTETDHLFALRAKPNGEATVSRKLGSVSAGESLEIKFDYYVAAPATAYNSSNYVDVRLESADASVSRTLLRYDSGPKQIKLLGDAAGSFVTTQSVPGSSLKSGFNKNNLVVVCKITPNSTGGYDATLTLTNDTANTLTATLPNILTAEEFLALDRFSFVNCTRAAGTLYGKGIAGIKNIIVTKSGATTIKEGDKVGIKFNNPTERPFDAKLMLVRYIDDQFSSMSVCDEVKRDQKTGYLTINATKEKPEENNFKVMLLDGEGNMKPLKSADNIVINEKKEMKALIIGNSFAQDTMEHMASVASSAGVTDYKFAYLYIGGCSINRHYSNAQNNTAGYTYYQNIGTGWSQKANYTIEQGIKMDDWDYIFIQHGTGDGSRYTLPASYDNLENLINYIKGIANPDAKIGFNMAWVMEPDSTHAEIVSYGGDQALMYQNLTTVTRDVVAPTAGLDVVSPAGTAIQNARTVITKKLTRDNFHLSYGLGRYIATLTFLKAAYNLDLSKVTWRPSDVTAEEAEIAKRAAAAACTTPYSVTNLK